MANLKVNEEFDTAMEQLTPETRAHADRFNERYEQLLGNDAFLKGKIEDANTNIERAMAVAQGKSAGYVFNTYSELIAYIAVPANVEKFRLGDQFLIKATDIPDYWWDNTVTTAQTDSAGNVISGKNTSGKIVGALAELEARKIDLSKYDANDAALFNNMSHQYSSARAYDVGDICIHNNDLYKCVTAVEAAETFNASKWNKTSLAALHADQEKKISENNQPPNYTVASSLSALTSGEKLSVAFGKIAKAVSTLISHISTKATSSVLGHVKLSDSTSSTSAASTGVAATPKAVKAAYDLANSNTKKLGTTDISSIGDGTVTGAIAGNKEAIEDINQSLDGCLKSVSDGKKTVASAITAQGVSTAADAEFATMAANIGSVGTNKYSAGRRQGRSDVTSSPNSYGLYTKSQYDSNYSTGQANGSNSAKSNGSKSAIWLIRNNSPASLLCYDGNYFTASGNTVYCKESGSYLIANEGYSLSGNININGSSSWYGDCNVYHGGTTRSLPAGGYITPNISANSSSGSAGIIIVRKA